LTPTAQLRDEPGIDTRFRGDSFQFALSVAGLHWCTSDPFAQIRNCRVLADLANR